MALLGASRTNIKRSLDNYFKDNITSAAGITTDFEGVPFDEKNISEWVAPRIIDFISDFSRQGSSTQYADNLDIIFSVNIFVKKGSMTRSGRKYAIRDIITKYFKINKEIYIYDYSGDGSTNVGSMKVREIITDMSLPDTTELYSYSLTFVINTTALTTNP